MEKERIILIEDTRNKIGKHNNIHSYCEKHNIEIVRKCLNIGDYTIEGSSTVIDTKENLDEISKNLMNKSDKSRFWKEVRRAKEQGIKLIVLCEHGGKIHSIKDVATWHSKYSPVSGRNLMEELYRVHIAYNVDFLFCDKRNTGRRIVELLQNDLTTDDV